MQQNVTPRRSDVDTLRLKLVETAEAAANVAGHYHDWSRLGVEDHHPPEMTLARLDDLENVLWAVVLAACDARLAAAGIRAQVERLVAAA